MSFLTGLALRRRSVTILVVLLALGAGIFTYNDFQRELFPEIEFPIVTIVTFYPSANPRAVERDVTSPIEDAISGISGLTEIQSTSSENLSLILATFEFGENLEEAERTIESKISSLPFPDGVRDSIVSRINSDVFPVLQLTLVGDRDTSSLQRIADDLIIPSIERVDGVFRVDVLGKVEEQVLVTVDTGKLEGRGVSLFQLTNAIRENNGSLPAGGLQNGGASFAVHTTHELQSLQEIRDLIVGFENPASSDGAAPVPVRVSDVADVTLGTAEATSFSRTNGKASLGLLVIKDPSGNTVEVTAEALENLANLEGVPPDVDVLVLSNDGPVIQEQLDNLLREGLLGFLFAVTVVFMFLITIRPTLLKGVALTLRPTAIIGLSIPLSLLTGILIMGFTDLTLNFMTLAGLAIAVGRVVDDSIVVLENTYRHIQRGEERLQAAFDATREVGAAIISSTLTTIAVFVPLAFIPGLVGSFFSPFALSVSFALIGSTLVALTAVPVLGAILLRRGDLVDFEGAGDGIRDTWWQRVYTPALVWSLRHKIATILIALVVTVGSLGLLAIIPITFFPAGTPEFVTISVALPNGTSVTRTFEEVMHVEDVLQDYEDRGIVEVYQATIGGVANLFENGGVGSGMNVARFIVRLAEEDVPPDIADRIRADLPGSEEVNITVTEITNGPPTDQLEINVTGSDFSSISSVAKQLEDDFKRIDGIINVASDVSEAKDEVVINVDPTLAAGFGLSTAAVGRQINQSIVGQKVSEIEIDGLTMDIVVKGRPESMEGIEKLNSLTIEGPAGQVRLGDISTIGIEQGPVSVSHFDSQRSASITGVIVAENTQAVGLKVQAIIDALDIPPGVEVRTGGIFQQIAEGFQDIFLAMTIGVVLVYLVMVASLGSLRNPFVIVLSLPLAVVGAFLALLITDRTLSLSALMGFLLLIGVVVTNAIVLLTFVEQLREQGYSVYDALVEGGRVRLRPILMTAFTTIFALLPLAIFASNDGGIIGAELATVVIGGLVSSTFLTLLVVPVVYTIMHVSIPGSFNSLTSTIGRRIFNRPTTPQGQPGIAD